MTRREGRRGSRSDVYEISIRSYLGGTWLLLALPPQLGCSASLVYISSSLLFHLHPYILAISSHSSRVTLSGTLSVQPRVWTVQRVFGCPSSCVISLNRSSQHHHHQHHHHHHHHLLIFFFFSFSSNDRILDFYFYRLS